MKYFTQPPIGTPLNPAHPLNQGLVGYWPMGEGGGTRVNDISGNGNHGVANMVQGTSSGWTGGKYGRAVRFNGISDKISVPNITLNGTVFSISAWVNLNTPTAGCMIFGQGNSANGNPIVSIQMFSGTTFELANRNDSTSGLLSYPAFTYFVDRWYHIVWTCTLNESMLYVNGVLINTVGFSVNSGATINTSFIGVRQRGLNESFFNGRIEQVRIYKRVLPIFEARQLYTDPFCMYEQENKYRWFNTFDRKGSFFFSRL